MGFTMWQSYVQAKAATKYYGYERKHPTDVPEWPGKEGRGEGEEDGQQADSERGQGGRHTA